MNIPESGTITGYIVVSESNRLTKKMNSRLFGKRFRSAKKAVAYWRKHDKRR